MIQNIKSQPSPLLNQLSEKLNCIVLKKPNTIIPLLQHRAQCPLTDNKRGRELTNPLISVCVFEMGFCHTNLSRARG